MSVFELVQLHERRKLTLDRPVRAWLHDALAHVDALPVTADIAVDAAQLRFETDPADRIIYATARSIGARLVTRDESLRRFDPILAVW